ncbi:MAG: carboxypeptidase regulatory-like domain-containing protein, partial [Candidatus Cloacimonetes bacterium]|nr:carboxypeptidase regulatory-like domain-containing protein [Candidatus Cloacimonadota bacterium]
MKKLTLISLSLLLAVFALADTYTIGTGTSATATNPFYGSYSYGWCKTIYTLTDINDAGLTAAADIIGIGWEVGNSPSNYVMQSQTVYVRNTTQEIYESTDISYPGTTGFDLAWQGTMTYNGSGWIYISFDTPFAWNGTGGIEFLYENRNGDDPTGYPTFRYTSTSSNYRTVYEGNDTEFPSATTGARSYSRANIRLVTPSTTAPDAAVVSFPLDGQTQIPPTASLIWMPGIIWPTGYRLYLGTDNPPTNLVNNQDLGNVNSYNPDPDLQLDTTYYWQVIPYNTFGDAADCPVWSFSTHGDNTVETLPYFQHFDAVTAPNLPPDWTSIIQSTSTSAFVGTYASTTYAHSQPYCVRLYNPSDADATLILIGPDIADPLDINEVRVRFYARSSGANYPVSIGVISDPQDASTYTEVYNLALTTTITEYIYDMTPYTGTGAHVAFKHGLGGSGRSIYLDDVSFELIAPNDLGCDALTGNVTPSVGTATTYNAVIHNWGTAAQSAYTVKLFDGNDTELASVAGVPIDPGMTVDMPLSWTPAAEGPAVLYAKVFLTGDINPDNDQSPSINVTVQPAGVITVTVGTGDIAEGIPLEFFYKNSLFQCLFYQTELNVYGQVTALTFYNNFATDLQDKPCKFWLGQTTLDDLSSGWILDGLTLVYDGTANFPAGQNTVTIPLQTPFNYTAGNLVLYANRPMDTQYFSSSDNFLAQEVGTNRARKLQSDSTTYDPAAPSAAGTLSGKFPMTSFSFVTSGFAALNGTVTSGGVPVADVDIVIDGTQYATITNVLGQYNFPFVQPGNYTVTASKLGYESQTLPVTLTADQTSTLDFTLATSSSVNVTGFVVGSDQPTVGLAEAIVSLSGVMDYSATTDATGHFTIPGVLSGNTYSYVIVKEGYQNLTGSITVGATAYDMGTLILPEIAFPASQVVATENIAQTQVDLIWHSPVAAPPYDDFEMNDGGWVSSGFGDWEWGDDYDVTNYVDIDTYADTPPPTAYSGTGMWGTVLEGGYSNCAAWSYLRKTFNLSGISNPVLSLWHYMDGYNTWDYGLITVNGTTVWGSSSAAEFMPWQELTVDLSAYGNQANVEIGFEWYATSVVSYAGWYIDDVYVGPPQARNVTFVQAEAPAITSGITETEGTALKAERTRVFAGSALQPQPRNDRLLVGYKVWRLLSADEGNETLWTPLTPSAIADTTFTDTAWAPLPSGVYKFAVKAVYTNDVLSAAAFSNEIHKGMMGTLSGTVTEFGTNVAISGATITAGDYSGTSGPDGSYAFLVYQGTYDVTCAKQGYQSSTVTGVNIVGTQTTTQNFVLTEITLPP